MPEFKPKIGHTAALMKQVRNISKLFEGKWRAVVGSYETLFSALNSVSMNHIFQQFAIMAAHAYPRDDIIWC